jgi:hypothetical protein
MEKAHEIEDPSQEAAADADLHQLVYESAHNVVLLHVMRVFGELLRNDVLYNRHQLYRRFGVRDQLLKQHLAIAKEILRGDPKADQIQFPDADVWFLGRDNQPAELLFADRIDILTSIGDADFNEYYARAVMKPIDGQDVPFLAADDLDVISPKRLP